MGSREIIPSILYAKNKKFELTPKELAILIGSVLGDGYITKKGRIQIEQCDKQKDYLFWKYSLLNRITNTSVLHTKRKNRKGFVTFSYRFWTKQIFRLWRNIFYPNDKKVIPNGIERYFSPLMLAIWYMDDGFLRKENSVAISTDRFDDSSLRKLKFAFRKRFDIDVSITARKKLYFGKKATQRFIQIISPYIIPTMKYKIP